MSAPEPVWLRRPDRPEVGPQAQYSITGTNIALGPGPHFATFVEFGVNEDEDKHFQAGIQWLMYNFSRFDEPSRHMLLSSVATHYGVPYAAIYGDVP